MVTILRNVFAIAFGVIVGASVNMGLILLGPHLIAPPAGVDVSNAKSIADSMHLYEAKHFVFPFLAHALGTLAGALTAVLVAGSHRAVLAYAIGIVFLAGGVAAAFMIPAPTWFLGLDLLAAYIPMAWIALRMGRGIRGESAAAPLRPRETNPGE